MTSLVQLTHIYAKPGNRPGRAVDVYVRLTILELPGIRSRPNYRRAILQTPKAYRLHLLAALGLHAAAADNNPAPQGA